MSSYISLGIVGMVLGVGVAPAEARSAPPSDAAPAAQAEQPVEETSPGPPLAPDPSSAPKPASISEPPATEPSPASEPPAGTAPPPNSEPAPKPPAEPKRHGFFSLSAPTMTGDWGGVRPALEDRGFKLGWYYTAQYQAVLKGGRDASGGGKHAASSDVILIFDLGKMGLIRDAELLAHGLVQFGYGVNRDTGALSQVNDDADGDYDAVVAQLWYRQHFFNHKLSWQIGYLNLQGLFDRNDYANSEDIQFMNSALDNNPLVPLNFALGTALTWAPVEWYRLVLSVADAQYVLYQPGFSTTFHDEPYFTAHVQNDFNVQIPSARGKLPGHYRVGVAYDPRARSGFPSGRRTPETRLDDYAFYLSVDQALYRESSRDDQGLGAFFRFGYRDSDFHRVSRFWSGGLSYKGLIPTRDEDVLGAGFALQQASDVYRARVDETFRHETIYEVYYAIQVADWMVVTPDFQYIDQPGGGAGATHAIVGGVRVRLSF